MRDHACTNASSAPGCKRHRYRTTKACDAAGFSFDIQFIRSKQRAGRAFTMPLSGSLALQDDVVGLFGCFDPDALVPEAAHIDVLEQPLPATQQDGRDGDMQLVDETCAEILPDRVRAAADA